MNKFVCDLISKKNSWIQLLGILPTLLLSACIYSDGTQLDDGIGGTGIVQGRLSKSGSIQVNGIDFNTDNAQFIRDGNNTTGLDTFNVGEIIKVIGTVNADRQSGTATEVIYTNLLEGPVTKTVNDKLLEVLGQQVITDQQTIFHGFKKLTTLEIDNIVEVSGRVNADGKIYASSIKLIRNQFNDGDTLEVEGSVSQLNLANQTFRINKLTVDYSQAEFEDFDPTEINNDMYLAVTATQNITDNIMKADTLILIDEKLEANVDYEIEGFITHFNSVNDFEIGGYPATTNADTLYTNGSSADIEIDSFMLLIGTTDKQGVLIAEEIVLLDYDSEIFAEANIESINPNEQTLTLLGQTITVDNFTLFSDDTTEQFSPLDFSQFVTGEPVFVIAYLQDDGDYVATRLSRVAPFELLYLSGQPAEPDPTQGNLTLFGNRVISDGNTLYLDEEDGELTRETFFNRMADSTGYIDVLGKQISNGFILADTMALGIEE